MIVPSVRPVAVGLLFVMLALCLVTLSLAIRKRRSDTRQARRRKRLRADLLEYLEADQNARHQWGKSLTDRERYTLASILEHYLRVLDGTQRKALVDLANELDIGDRANAQLDAPSLPPKLDALTTLALLEYPISKKRLIDTTRDNQRTREAAARLLYHRSDEFDDTTELGTRLLIWNGQEPLSIYGLDTLATLNTGPTSPLLSYAATNISGWDEEVIMQVCLVLEQVEQIDPEEPIEWVLQLLSHQNSGVRAAAIRGLKHQGWRRSIREQLDVDALLSDPDKNVRQATFEVLAYWGDAESESILREAVMHEEDKRCQLVCLGGLLDLEADIPRDDPAFPVDAWTWVVAERGLTTSDYDEASNRSRSVI